jgi:hypothetical protein
MCWLMLPARLTQHQQVEAGQIRQAIESKSNALLAYGLHIK